MSTDRSRVKCTGNAHTKYKISQSYFVSASELVTLQVLYFGLLLKEIER